MIIRVTKRRNRYHKAAQRNENLQQRRQVNMERSHNPLGKPNWHGVDNRHSPAPYKPNTNTMKDYEAAYDGAARTARGK